MANENPNPSAGGPSSKPEASQETKAREAHPGGGTSQRSTQRGGEQRASSRLARREPSSPFGFLSASPFSLMRRMMEDMDRAFEEYLPSRFASPGERAIERARLQGGAIWAPQVDVYEREGRFVVRADLPGLRKEDVHVDVTDEEITIAGERRQEREVEAAGVYRAERVYGSFSRAIPLPEGVELERAEAHFENGVLEITIPLGEHRAKSRRLEVQGTTPQSSVH